MFLYRLKIIFLKLVLKSQTSFVCIRLKSEELSIMQNYYYVIWMSLFLSFTVSGNLGCVANVYDSNSNQHYVSLYNYDSASDIDGTTIFQFTCVVSETVL